MSTKNPFEDEQFPDDYIPVSPLIDNTVFGIAIMAVVLFVGTLIYGLNKWSS